MLACRKREILGVWVLVVVFFLFFFSLIFVGKETEVFESTLNCLILLCQCAQFLCSALAFWTTGSLLSVLWTHLGVDLLRRCHQVFYLLLFIPMISTLSAMSRHSTSHFEMQCLDPIKWCWKEMFKQYLRENGPWGLEGEVLNWCQIVLSFTLMGFCWFISGSASRTAATLKHRPAQPWMEKQEIA